MNYQEMINNREGAATQQEQMPIGTYYRKLIDKKYRYVVELKPRLTDNIVFCESLRSDQLAGLKIRHKQQLHYELHEDSSGIYEIELETGNYLTLSQALHDNPALVAAKGFVDDMVQQLIEYVTELNSQGIFHLCFAPQTVLLRKGNNVPLVLCHGSSFIRMSTPADLYSGFEHFVAPEVLDRQDIDERSDVYALGRLIEYLFSQGTMPYEYKKVVKKATAEAPEDRYGSVGDMLSDIKKKRSMLKSTIMLIAATAIVALGVWLYFDLIPEPVVVEYENHPQPQTEDPLDDYSFDPEDEVYDPDMMSLLGINPDSVDLSTLSDEEMQQITDSANQVMKAEEIFRRKFTQAAERKLSGIYNNAHLGANEQDIIAASQATMDDLMEVKDKLAGQAGLGEERASRIFTEVISDVIARQQQPQQSDDE